MADGIRIINDWGTVLLDANEPCMVVVASSVVTLGSDGSAFIGNYQSGKVAARGTYAVSSAWFSNNDPYQPGVYLFGTPGDVVTWYLFDQPNSESNVGFKLKNGSGQLTFDSGMKPCRIVALSTGAGWAGTVSLPGGRTYATMPLNPAFSSAMSFTRVGAGSPQSYFQREDLILAGGVQSGNNVILTWTNQFDRQYGPYSGTALPAGYTTSVPRGSIAVVDVSNY